MDAQWLEHFTRFEGDVDHFYLDGVGIVSIGIGCRVFDPKLLPMLRRSDNAVATEEEIMTDYYAIRALPNGLAISFYHKVCKLYLPAADVVALFEERLQETLLLLVSRITDLQSYPEPAVLAIMDMAYNLGIGGLFSKFPKFVNGFKAKDWHVCSLECRRNGIQWSRNVWTREVFDQLSYG